MKSIQNMVISTVILMFMAPMMLFAQLGPEFGPYTPDANTVMLMSFDTEATFLENEATVTGATDGVAQGALALVPEAFGVGAGFGGALHLDNSTSTDANHVSVPDYDALDLNGSWTLEGWFYPLSYSGAANGGWAQRHPSILRKGIENVQANSNNYQVVWDASLRRTVGMGKYTDAGWNTWFEVGSAEGSIQTFNWYHFAMVRDTSNASVMMLIHDQNGELLSTNVGEDWPLLQGYGMELNDEPLTLGTGPNWNDVESVGGVWTYYDGYMDEIRVSNIARVYQVPIGAAGLICQNVLEGETPEISIETITIPGNAISGTPIVHYSADAGVNWSTVASVETGDQLYTATLPTGVFGDVYHYYVTIENTFGQVSTFPIEATNAEPDYNAVGFWQAETKTLDLSFEEGSGTTTVDGSIYGNEVVFGGLGVEFSTDVPPALIGTSSYSIALNMNLAVDEPETCYVEIPRPALWVNGEYGQGWSVDFWAKTAGIRWEDRPGGFGQIWLLNGGSLGNFRLANYNGDQYWFSNGQEMQLAMPEAEIGNFWDKWFHYVGTCTGDSIYLWVYDENDAMIAVGAQPNSAENQQNNSYVRLGHSHELGDIMRGYIDEFKFYNYPALFDDIPVTTPRGEMILNGGAEDGVVDPWIANDVSGDGTFTADIDATNPISGSASLHLDIDGVGGSGTWNQQFQQLFNYQSGRNYLINFKARSDQNLEISMILQRNEDPWTGYIEELLSIGPDIQDYSFVSTGLPDDEHPASFAFLLGQTSVVPSEIWFDDVSVIEAQEMIGNGDLEADATVAPWIANDVAGNGDVTIELETTSPIDGDASLHINVDAIGGGGNWNQQVQQVFEFTPGMYYMINFDAKASEEMTIDVILQRNEDPWTTYALETITLSTDVQSYSLTSDQPDGDYPASFAFLLGQASAVPSDIWIDNVTVYESPSLPPAPTVSTEEFTGLPIAFSVSQNYPNPFNPSTTLSYTMPEADYVTVKVFDVLGQEIQTLESGQKVAGVYSLTWNGMDHNGLQVASGIYYYQVSIAKGEISKTRKMLLLK